MESYLKLYKVIKCVFTISKTLEAQKGSQTDGNDNELIRLGNQNLLNNIVGRKAYSLLKVIRI